MSIRDLMDRRATLISDARSILDAAEVEDRGLSDEEEARYGALMTDVTSLGTRIERETQQAGLEDNLEARSEEHPPEPPNAPPGDQRTGRDSDEYRQAFAGYLRGGIQGVTAPELRALQADNDVLGGYLVTPMQFVDGMLMAVDNVVYIRQWATNFRVPNAESLGVPSLDTDPADANWTTELATGSEDSDMAFGKRVLYPRPLAKRIKVSRKLLRMVPDAEGLVLDRLAYKFGITWEKAALTGSGSGEPLGVFTASDDGIPTSRDVSTDNTATAITFDGLTEAKFALKGQYWPRARWLFHRDGVKMISKLKDGNGQYLWRESVRVGEPDRILGLAVFMSEYAPNTFTASQYVGILGDFAFYWTADALDMEIQRLVELYAETNQVGLIGRLESDGQPVMGEAFVRVKLAAS